MPSLTTKQETAMHNRNKQNFSRLNPGDATFFRQGGQVVLIGDGHDPVVVKMVEESPAYNLGQIKLVRAAKGKDKGELLISGAGGQFEFKKEIELLMSGAEMKFTKWQAAR